MVLKGIDRNLVSHLRCWCRAWLPTQRLRAGLTRGGASGAEMAKPVKNAAASRAPSNGKDGCDADLKIGRYAILGVGVWLRKTRGVVFYGRIIPHAPW